MAGFVDLFRSYTNTKARRHSFYCYCTTKYNQDQAVFFLLVEAYEQSRLKRQAAFLKDWFLDGNIPAALDEGGYLSQVNIDGKDRKQLSTDVNNAVSTVGKTFSDKRAKHGGGVGGFFGALRQKMGDTKLDGDLFKEARGPVVGMLSDARLGFGDENGKGATYLPDHKYQPNGAFAHQVPIFRKHLKAAGFDPDNLGIY